MQSIVLPLTYFGNIAYFKHFISDNEIWIDDREPYLKQTFRNRTRILGANGPLDLGIPVKSTKGQRLTIDEIEISYAENWPEKHWRSIKSAYQSSPFFDEFRDDIKTLLMLEEIYLVDLNKTILEQILDLLEIEKSFFLGSKKKKPESFTDYRTHFKPSKSPEWLTSKKYPQVFNYKFDFVPNLSVLDLLFNEGPYSIEYLIEVANS